MEQIRNKSETVKDISFYNTFKKLIKQHFILNPVKIHRFRNHTFFMQTMSMHCHCANNIPHKNLTSISLYLNIVNTTVFTLHTSNL